MFVDLKVILAVKNERLGTTSQKEIMGTYAVDKFIRSFPVMDGERECALVSFLGEPPVQVLESHREVMMKIRNAIPFAPPMEDIVSQNPSVLAPRLMRADD